MHKLMNELVSFPFLVFSQKKKEAKRVGIFARYIVRAPPIPSILLTNNLWKGSEF